MQSVATRNVSIRADRSLLADFTWAHSPGGIAWLVGTNGSGKSSLLRALAGWAQPSAGTIRWSGVRAEKLHYFNPAMSAGADVRVVDFIALVQTLTPVAAPADLRAFFPETATATKRFSQLSTGEAKRLLLWAVLRHPSGPLLLDEPYEHLSRDAKTALTDVLRARAESDIVIVATNQDVPESNVDTVLTFNGDRIEVGHVA